MLLVILLPQFVADLPPVRMPSPSVATLIRRSTYRLTVSVCRIRGLARCRRQTRTRPGQYYVGQGAQRVVAHEAGRFGGADVGDKL